MTIETLMTAFVVVAVGYLVYWLIGYLKVEDPFRTILVVLDVLIVIVVLLGLVGVGPHLRLN